MQIVCAKYLIGNLSKILRGIIRSFPIQDRPLSGSLVNEKTFLGDHCYCIIGIKKRHIQFRKDENPKILPKK